MNTLRTTRRRQAVAVATLSALLLLAGCGNGDDTPPTATEASASADATAEATASPSEDPTAEGIADDSTTEEPTGIADRTRDDSLVAAREDVFDVRSPWNRPVLTRLAHPQSALMLENSKIRRQVGFDGQVEPQRVNAGVYVNTREWTVPVVAGGEPTIVRCRQLVCGDGDEPITLDIPTDVDPNPLYDGWFTVFSPEGDLAYDLWRARREDDGSISYHFMRIWDLDGQGYSRPYVAASRGSGLPLFAGLIRPGELQRGDINHALAISIPGPAADFFVAPASSTNGNNTNRLSVPLGARLRLRADFQLQPPVDEATGQPLPFTAQQRRNAQIVVDALKEYGAFAVDRAAVPTLYYEAVTDGTATALFGDPLNRRNDLVDNPTGTGTETGTGLRDRTGRLGDESRVNGALVDLDQRASTQLGLLAGYELQSIGLEDFEVVDFRNLRQYPFPPEEILDPNAEVDAEGATETDTAPGDAGTSTTSSTESTESTEAN